MALKIIKKGILTTELGLGKTGLRHLGINPSGAMDKITFRLLNILLQKREEETMLEIYFPSVEIEFTEDSLFVIGGADFSPVFNEKAIDNWRVLKAESGDILKFKKKIKGNCCYLAHRKVSYNITFLPYLGYSLQNKIQTKTNIRYIIGSEFKHLTALSKEKLAEQYFAISIQSNRMGYRLEGNALEIEFQEELISSAVDFGTMQLLPNGQIIVLMADHQTSGGYPKIGNVISVDLPILAQLGANVLIRFEQVSINEAENLFLAQEAEIMKLKATIGYKQEMLFKPL